MDRAKPMLGVPLANVQPFLDILVHTTNVVSKELAAQLQVQEFDYTPLIYAPRTADYRESRRAALREAADAFREQSRQLEDAERKIARERLRLRRMSEACETALAPISGLPLELLHEIFLCALYGLPERPLGQTNLRTRLSLTCKHWNRAVRSLPEMWDHIGACADTIDDLGPLLSLAPPRKVTVVLKKSLAHTGTEPSQSWTSNPALRGKITALRIAHNAPLSVLEGLLAPALPHLSSLFLEFVFYGTNRPRVVHIRIPGRSLPQLGHLFIQAPMISSITFDGADIKTLIFTGTKIRPDKTINAISQELPGLEEMSFAGVTMGSHANSPIVTANLPPTLQKLTFDHSSIELTRAILFMHTTESSGLSSLRELIIQLPSVHPDPPGIDHTNFHHLEEHELPPGFGMAVAFAKAARRMLALEKLVISGPVTLVQHLLSGLGDDPNTGAKTFPKLNHMDVQVTDPWPRSCTLNSGRQPWHHCSHDLEQIKMLMHETVYERKINPTGAVFLRLSECFLEKHVRSRIRAWPNSRMQLVDCKCVEFED